MPSTKDKRNESPALNKAAWVRILEIAQEGICLIDKDDTAIFINKRLAAMLGYTIPEVVGRNAFDFVFEEDLPTARKVIEKSKSNVFNPLDFRFRHSNGSAVWVIASSAPLKDNRSHYIGTLWMITDITERKQTEEALKKSEEKYRELVENANSIILRMDPHGRVTFFNEFAQKFFGYSASEILGKNVVGTIVPEKESSGRDLKAMIKEIGRHPDRYVANENENICRNGERVWVAWANKALYDAQGKISEILCVGNDLTEHKKALDRLQAEARINSAFSRLYEPFISADSTLEDMAGIVWDRAKQLTGSRHGFVSVIDQASGDNVAYAFDNMLDGMHGFYTKNVPQINFSRGADGTYPGLWGHVLNTREGFFTNTSRIHPMASGLPKGHTPIKRFLSVPVLIGSLLVGQIALANPDHDYTEQDLDAVRRLAEFFSLAIQHKQATDALQESEQRYRLLFNTGNDMVQVFRINAEGTPGSYLEVNDVTCKKLGYTREELLKLTPMDTTIRLKPEEKLALLDQVLINREVVFKGSRITKEGKKIPVEIRAHLFEFGGAPAIMEITRDISELKKAEEALLIANKFESVGILAGGITHDFRNILTAILNNISYVKNSFSAQDELHEVLSETESAVNRANALTEQLISFSKSRPSATERIQLAPVIKESSQLALSGSQCKLQFHLPADLWPVMADKVQLGQVINNIVLNAVQAMPQGGKIVIAGENIDLTQTPNPLPLKKGPFLKLSIQDQGAGIPEENLAKIFDPYFTTKKKGSGLGLSTSYSIIKNHQGLLTVESEAGRGATFLIYLPAVPPPTVVADSPMTSAQGLSSPHDEGMSAMMIERPKAR